MARVIQGPDQRGVDRTRAHHHRADPQRARQRLSPGLCRTLEDIDWEVFILVLNLQLRLIRSYKRTNIV
jgi:hypothetical protein